MAKLKDLIKENFSVVGGVVSTPPLNSGTSLTSIVEDMYGKKEEKVSAKQIQQSIKEFSSFSKVLQKEENLKQIANNAKSYTLSETEDWFDKVTVNRNMKELTNLSKSFGKIAQESQQLQQRLGGLYEDMGHVLGRYFEIEGDADKSDLVKIGLENPDEDDLPKGTELEEGDYEAFFQSALKKFGVKSPDELGDDDKKKEFFNYVDKNYKAKAEARI